MCAKKELLVYKELDAEDFLLGNVFSVASAVLGGWFLHKVVMALLQDLREKAIKKARRLQAEADKSGVQELAIPEPACSKRAFNQNSVGLLWLG